MEISPDFFLMLDSVFLPIFTLSATADWICTPNPVELEKKNETELGTTMVLGHEKKKLEFAGNFSVFKGLNWRAFGCSLLLHS
jgi:hypothetical protein